LHLACAEVGGAAYFVTCDDDIIKRVRKNQNIVKVAVFNPLEFILEEVFENACEPVAQIPCNEIRTG
jgi:hypothetical protein